jgi:hypothetical protein
VHLYSPEMPHGPAFKRACGRREQQQPPRQHGTQRLTPMCVMGMPGPPFDGADVKKFFGCDERWRVGGARKDDEMSRASQAQEERERAGTGHALQLS